MCIRDRIRTYHNSRMIIPNSVINKAIVENSNYTSDYIGNYMEVSVSYESDLEKAIEVMKETIEGHPLVVDIRPDPSEGAKVSVMVKALADDGICLLYTAVASLAFVSVQLVAGNEYIRLFYWLKRRGLKIF